MNLQFLLEKLYASEEFEKFKKENSDAFPCSCFFVIDLSEKNPEKKYHVDFFVPSVKKMFSFQTENSPITILPVEIIGETEPNKIMINYELDFDKIIKLVKDKMNSENIKNKLEKILISLQNIKVKKQNKDFLICTIFISGFGLIKLNIDIVDWKITDFEKKSFIDFLRKG